MAFHWRIRHKLMLGLGLVVGLIALLLAGTLYGLSSFRTTMKRIESKHAELNEAERFKAAVSNLKGPLGAADVNKLLESIQAAREALDVYEGKLNETIQAGRDPNQGFEEREIIKALRGGFDKLDKAAQHRPSDDEAAVVGRMPGGQPLLKDQKDINDAFQFLQTTSGDLREAIYHDLGQRSRDAREQLKTSLWIVFSVSGVGVLLLGCLLRFFYGWMFSPIRELQEGAGRVAQGDFDHRIGVHSGDELEDLANAFNDMTGRLREMYRDLARQVNERSRQLVRSERLASVGFLAAGVAHEINNPLHSIALCSEALERRLGESVARTGENGETIFKYLKMIQEEAFRCKGITQRLLEFSRGGERRREPTDLAEVIQSVLDMLQHLPTSKGKHIRFKPPSPFRAWVNAQEIKSVVLNLVVNALDSMDDGGTLTIALAQRDRMAEMTVSDTGCGMAPETLENIFEPFYTRSRTGKGTGLGLSISHRIINQHGGEIEATSPGLNGGSTFTVRLPLQPADSVKEESLGRAAA